jgi:hypothetical protein
MTAEDLLADLEASGLTLRREGGQLLVSPTSGLTPQNREQIREHKQGLLVALSVRQAMAEALPAILEENDALGEAVRLVERVVLVWPDGEAMAFDPEFVRWWESYNAEVARARK